MRRNNASIGESNTMTAKLTHDEAYNRCKIHGFILLDNYINNDIKYRVICPICKNVYKAYIADIWRGKVKRCINCKRKGNCKILLSESLTFYHLMGLILSDGTIHHPTNRISITLHKKDEMYLQNMACLFDINVRDIKKSNKIFTEFAICDKRYVPKFINKFGLKPNKTYNPPHIKNFNLTDEQRISMAVGFIDGDGHISRKNNKPYNITIKGHYSWLHMYEYMFNNFYTSCKISNSNQATCHIGVKNTEKLVNIVKTGNLRAMNRKWK